MHACLRLYDAVLDLLERETEALDQEDEARLPELCEKRTALMAQAWESRAGCSAPLLREKLEAVRAAQALLTAKAAMQRDTLRLALQSSRRENTRLAGYGKVVASRQNALIVSKEG